MECLVHSDKSLSTLTHMQGSLYVHTQLAAGCATHEAETEVISESQCV